MRHSGHPYLRLLLLSSALTFALTSATLPIRAETRPPADDVVADLLGELSLEDKVGQLFLLSFGGSGPSGATAVLHTLHPGGLVLIANASSVTAARELTDALQQQSAEEGALPFLFAMNYEGGDVQPIRDGVIQLGSNAELGQVQPTSAAVRAACSRGALHGRELASMGIQINLAPVVDVWDNPQNTVIGDRSYGSNPDRVAALAAAYIEGLQGEGILATAKHFPGHGSSAEDSHRTLPVVAHDRAWMDSHELVPFRAAIGAQVAAVMTAHVAYPAMNPGPARPATLAPEIVTGLLRQELGFDGLVISDDLGAMRAITDYTQAGEAAVEAIEAGSDLLTVVGALERQASMVQSVRAAVGTRIPVERLDAAVSRVLRAKQQAGLLPGGGPPLIPPIRVCA